MIIFVICVLAVTFIAIAAYSKEPWINIGIIFIMLLLFACIKIYNVETYPQPIDVYRNRTDLKIKGYYKDSVFIPTDSIVVFKQPS